MAAKKKAKTETATTTKKSKEKVTTTAKPAGAFNILKSTNFAESLGQSLKTTLEKRKGREVSFCKQSELIMERLPVRSIYLQWAMNSRGLAKGLTDIVAKDRCGKTSLVYYLFGGFMQAGYPCGFISCENKPLEDAWARRCLSSDPGMAEAMASNLLVLSNDVLDQMAESIEAWCKLTRDPASKSFVPPSIPMTLAVDPIGRLATRSQAAGLTEFDGLDKEKQIDIMDKGHSWDRAKWLHDWIDRLLLLQKRFNVHLIAVEHQNEQNPAGGGAMMPAYIPAHVREASHRTKRGGQSINQIANLQWILVDAGFIYSAGEKIARKIKLSTYKNSYGPENRDCYFALKLDSADESSDSYLDPGLRFDYTEVDWMAENGYLGFRRSGTSAVSYRYSSDELQFNQVSLAEAAQAWREADPRLIEALGAQLKIPGYLKTYESVMEEIKG